MIGYYVHHQGRGHLHRAMSICAHVREPVTVLSSLPRPADWAEGWIALPPDTVDSPADPTAGGRLHWVPLHHAGLRERMGIIAEWIRREEPRLFVSDVSVEAATLARLMGTPVVVAAMRGDRSDEAHRLAYDFSDALLAPWPQSCPEPGWPPHWQAKTLYTGSISRYDGRPRRAPGNGCENAGREVVVMLGGGGTDLSGAQLRNAAEATPGWTWTALAGPGTDWVEDPWPILCRADVVVTHAGQNAIAECAAARVPTIVIPQDRPHGEQHATARALRRAELATVLDAWPASGEWPALLEDAAVRVRDRWELWSPGDGAQRAARLLSGLALGAPERIACGPR
ncbi:glycosyltransferase [Streptomyces roseus]|uniref:glycosyltransferase n=1 Tax=Streptomyces roseus TaxID=66430 RepID=UPI00382E7646